MSGRDKDTPVLIAGGGIGGLAASIALARQGVFSRILERSSTFSEAGAGIQIGPNVMRVLNALGASEHLAPHLVFPDAIRIFDGRTGRPLTEMPLGSVAEARYGAPYATAHRADLQAALVQTARVCPEIDITMDFELSRFVEEDNRVTAHTVGDARAEGSLLIAADGISSRVRAQLDTNAKLQFCERTAWRTLIDRDDAPALLREKQVGLWLGPEAHLVHYPVRGGTAINLVAVIEDSWDKEGWNTQADPTDLMPHFSRWCGEARELLSAGPAWRKWALFALPDLTRWQGSRTVLLGDAAHPVLPFLAQGAGLAIEDALSLAKELAASGTDNPTSAFENYVKARRPRATRLQTESRRMGAVYHYGGAMGQARNVALRLSGPERNLARFDWLYQFEV